MKPKKNSTPRIVNQPAAAKSSRGLNLTPANADREAAKLRELRDDLESGKSEQDTSIRSSPLGRND